MTKENFTCHSTIDTSTNMRLVSKVKTIDQFSFHISQSLDRFMLLIFLLPLVRTDVYVPGTPGAAWSQDELLIVKSKLYALFNKRGNIRAPVLLRLGFHDCLKYADGSGGCDGCLNWEGVGYRYPNLKNFTFPNIDRSNNNGLENAVAILERLYTEPDFPQGRAPSLSISLRDSGKSRADLWAFAAIVAVEYTTETNNKVCTGNFYHNPGITCNYKILNGKPCHISFPNQIKFQTGRKDCTEQILEQPYQTSKEESHPRVVGNGKDTTDFFQKDFGFTGRETVAIMGGHTIGHFNRGVSLFIYTWTGMSRNAFNNDYYGNLARVNKVAFPAQNCTIQTDAEGREGAARWVTNVRKQTENGGPAFWIHETYRCFPSCHQTWKTKDHHCCKGLAEGQYCRPDSDLMEDDPSGINQGCEQMMLIFAADEMAINSEMGLYFDFKVTDDGIPYGCPQFDGFNTQSWKSNQNLWSEKPGIGRNDPECPLQTLAVPEGSTPLHQIVEEYAEDQDAWIRDFIPALEKMLANGYNSHDLQDSSLNYSFDQVHCNRPIFTDYYVSCNPDHFFDDSKSFFLMPLVANEALAVQGEESGYAKIVSFDLSDDTQRWLMGPGNVIVNLATKNPLQADSAKTWIFDEANDFLVKNGNDEDSVLTALCLDCKLVVSKQPGNEGLVQYFAAISKEALEGQDALEVLKEKAEGMDFIDTLTRIEDEQKFMIKSEFDQRVVDHGRLPLFNEQFRYQFMNTVQESNANQLWVKFETSTGIKIMNVGQKDVLKSSNHGVYEWTYNEDTKLLLDSSGSGKALRRGKKKKDGQEIGQHITQNYSGRTKYVFIPVFDV